MLHCKTLLRAFFVNYNGFFKENWKQLKYAFQIKAAVFPF